MKISQMIFPLMTFVIFILFGQWTGNLIERSVRMSEQENFEKEKLAEATKLSFSTLTAGSNEPTLPAKTLGSLASKTPNSVQQKNLLVIGVDDMTSPKPNLVGVWLVLYLTDMAQVTLMPVYPAVYGNNGALSFAADHYIFDSFQLSLDGSPHPDFLKILTDRGLWWTNFAVLDKESIIALSAFTDGTNLLGLPEVEDYGTDIKWSKQPDSEQQPEASLLAQTRTIQEICHKSSFDLSAQQVTGLITDLKGHLSTDISPEQVIKDLKGMLMYGGEFICDFPSLAFAPRAN